MNCKPFYFVCQQCPAKFFHHRNSIACSRCGKQLISDEQRSPPWNVAEAVVSDRKWAEEKAEDYLDDNGIDPNRVPVLRHALTDYYMKMKRA